MKQGLSALVFALAFLGCFREDPSTPDTSSLEWVQPRHPRFEVYINQYSLSPTQGVIGRPNFEAWSPNVQDIHTFSTNQEGEPPYAAKIEYKGTAPDGDHYLITISHPAQNNMETIALSKIYNGAEIELFKDDEYRIGIRPRSDNSDSEQVSGGNG